MKYSYGVPEWAQLARKCLIDRNMTVKEIAAALGYNRSYTSNLLNGVMRSRKAEKRICEFLGIQEKEAG